MGSLSNYGETAFITHLCGAAPGYDNVATLYLALATGDPGEAATGASMSECANSGSYARKAISFSAAGSVTSRAIKQTGAVVFDAATGSWGTVSNWAVVDSGTHGAGNVLAYGAFASSFAVVSGNVVTIATTQVYVSIGASDGEGFTTQFVHWMLDMMFRNQVYAQPDTYIALLDTVGADTDTTLTTAGKEISGTDYARVLVNKTGGASPAWNTITNGVTDNANAVTFATVGAGGWAGIVGMAIVDGGTLNAGNVLAYDNDQVVDQSANAADTVTFAANALDISIT